MPQLHFRAAMRRGAGCHQSAQLGEAGQGRFEAVIKNAWLHDGAHSRKYAVCIARESSIIGNISLYDGRFPRHAMKCDTAMRQGVGLRALLDYALSRRASMRFDDKEMMLAARRDMAGCCCR